MKPKIKPPFLYSWVNDSTEPGVLSGALSIQASPGPTPTAFTSYTSITLRFADFVEAMKLVKLIEDVSDLSSKQTSLAVFREMEAAIYGR